MFSDLVIEFALVSASAQKAAHSRRAAAQPGFSPCAHDSFLVSSRYLISRSGFSFPFQPQHAANHAGNSLPVFRFQIELLLPAFCNGIKLRFAIVLGRAPLRRNPALLLQSQQRGVHRALVELEDIAADLLNAPRNSES